MCECENVSNNAYTLKYNCQKAPKHQKQPCFLVEKKMIHAKKFSMKKTSFPLLFFMYIVTITLKVLNIHVCTI